ncbi:MAG: hypothetical protein IPO21_04500 [Bacteroidales bacterium]|nr:hypothetical protein [Bacteroidales bacterium]
MRLLLTDQGSKTLGASGASTGSYYSVETNTVYTTADAKTNVAKINIVYNYDATDGAQVYSPKLSTALGSLTGVTETKFVKSTIAFATAKPADLTAVTPTETKIKNLAKDDVIVFKTEAGKMGIFLVESIVASADGTAVLKIKVK